MSTSLLLHAFARRERPLTFSELAVALAGTGATVSELLSALAEALQARMVEPQGFATSGAGALGPRLLVLSERGRVAVAADRA